MAEPERPWYQDGCAVAILVAMVVVVLGGWYYLAKTPVELEVSGALRPGIFAGGNFSLDVWHISPGTLSRGRLTVVASGPPLEGSPVTRHHAFETWAPNEDQQVTLEFPLKNVPEAGPIDFTITVTAARAWPVTYTVQWSGDGWATPLQRQLPSTASSPQ